MPFDFRKLNVQVSNGMVFTGEESAVMAYLIFKRFGSNLQAGAHKWRQLLSNSSSDGQYHALVEQGKKLWDNRPVSEEA